MLGTVSSIVRRAEWALHRRAALACEAATDASVPGRFRVWQHAGVMAVLATDPALGFLATVSGVTRETLPAAIDLARSTVWETLTPTILVSADLGNEAEASLRTAGLVQVDDRILAIKQLGDTTASPATCRGRQVVEVNDADNDFVRVLLAGYETEGVVAAFITAEHRAAFVRRFLVLDGQVSIAATAMSIHGDVAVLGGASTLPAHRRSGAQSLALRHRLREANDAGCALAVATARPESVSAANLRRAGFRIVRRSAWKPT